MAVIGVSGAAPAWRAPQRTAVSSAATALVGLVILVGLVGIVLPVLPGAVLVFAAILVWAIEVGTSGGWLVFAVATVALAVSQVAKYVIPGRRLAADKVPRSTMLVGAVAGIVGFFVVPVVGLPLGFLLAVYVVERLRLGSHAAAWPSTKAALRAVGVSMLIELAGALVAAGVWSVAALVGV